MSNLPDICKNRHKGNSASIDANKKVNKTLDRQNVLSVFMIQGNSYSKEIARYLNKPLNSISGRLSELKADGILEPTGQRLEGCEVLKIKK